MVGLNRKQLDESIIDFFSYKVAIYLYVFGLLVENGVGGIMYCCSIVTKDHNRSPRSYMKVEKQLMYPYKFIDSRGQRMVLSFSIVWIQCFVS